MFHTLLQVAMVSEGWGLPLHLEGILGTTDQASDLLSDEMVAFTIMSKITDHDGNGPMGNVDVHGEIRPHWGAGVAQRCQKALPALRQ